jgi:very-short-patch-repair endonuclease
MHFGAPQQVFQNAKELKANLTVPEKILWEELKKGKLGVKFRRQHPIDLYILDFYCHELKLSIELDGGYHLNQEQKILDEDRTKNLKKLGIKEIRYYQYRN